MKDQPQTAEKQKKMTRAEKREVNRALFDQSKHEFRRALAQAFPALPAAPTVAPRAGPDDRIMQWWLTARSHGASEQQCATALGVGDQWTDYWTAQNPAFREIRTRATVAAEARWETYLMTNLENRDIQPQFLKMLMANRFGWSDKVESKQEVTHKSVADQIRDAHPVIDAERVEDDDGQGAA